MPKRLFDSEKKMEDWFCNEVKSRDYENFIGRQVSTVSGRLDVLSYYNGGMETPLSLRIYELKNDKIRYKDVAQVLYYKHELINIVLSQYDIDNGIADYVYEEFSWFMEPYILGTGIKGRALNMLKALRRESIRPLIVIDEQGSLRIKNVDVQYLQQDQINNLPSEVYSDIAKKNKEFLKEYLGGIDWKGEMKQDIMEEYMK